MRAIVCETLGDATGDLGSGVLRLKNDFTLPSEVPAGSVRIKVAAASLNFADALQIKGQYQVRPKLPFVPGSEASGVVVAVGPGCSQFKVGDKVCTVGTGAFAEELIAPETATWHVPEGCDLEDAAGLPVAFGTAELALVRRAGVRAGQTVLVLGAAGGVGVAAVQISVALGARVIAAATGSDRCAFVRSQGAAAVIDLSDLKDTPFHKAVKAVAPKGVNAVFDPVGGKLFDESLKTLAWGGHYLVIGFAAGGNIPKPPANLLLVKNATLHGVFWGSYMEGAPEVLRAGMEWILGAWRDGRIRVPVSHRFPLEQTPEAFRALLSRQVMGKVLVTTGGSGSSSSSSNSSSSRTAHTSRL